MSALPVTVPAPAHIQAAVSGAAAGLGVIAWPTLRGGVTPAALRKVYKGEGLGVLAKKIPDIVPVEAIRAAARSYTLNRGKDRFRSEALTTPQTGASLSVALLKHYPAAGGVSPKWLTETIVDFDDNGRPLSPIPAPSATLTAEEAAVRGFAEEAEQARTLLGYDYLRREVIGLIERCMPIPLRDRAGIVFIPNSHREEAERVARIVAEIGASRFDLFDVAPSATSRASVADSVEMSFTDQIREVEEKIAEIENAEVGDRTSSTYVSRLVAQIDDIRGRVDLFTEILEGKAQDLRAGAERVKDKAAALFGLDNGTTRKVAAPSAVAALAALMERFPARFDRADYPAGYHEIPIAEIAGAGLSIAERHWREFTGLAIAGANGCKAFIKRAKVNPEDTRRVAVSLVLYPLEGTVPVEEAPAAEAPAPEESPAVAEVSVEAPEASGASPAVAAPATPPEGSEQARIRGAMLALDEDVLREKYAPTRPFISSDVWASDKEALVDAILGFLYPE